MAARYWTRDDTISLVTMAGIICAGFALANVADGPKVYAGIALTLTLALIVGAITWRVSRSRSAVWVEADEGGVRVRGHAKKEWIPYSRIHEIGMKRSFGQPTLALGNRTFVLGEGHSLEVEQTILDRMRAARATAASPLATSFVRGGLSLDEWVGRLDGGSGYRSLSVDEAEIRRVGLDEDADVEVRAGAVYKIFRGRDEEARAQVLDAMTKAATASVTSLPPLVLLMAFAGSRQGDHIPGFDDAKEFLSDEDIRSAERMRESRLRIRIGTDPSELLAEDEAIAEAHHARKA